MAFGAQNDKGFTLWFTGLSGAGKTTVSKLVEEELANRRRRLEILDAVQRPEIGVRGVGAGGRQRIERVEHERADEDMTLGGQDRLLAVDEKVALST